MLYACSNTMLGNTLKSLSGRHCRGAISRSLAGAASSECRFISNSAGLTGRTKELIDMEDKYGAHNYHPVPVVLEKAKGE